MNNNNGPAKALPYYQCGVKKTAPKSCDNVVDTVFLNYNLCRRSVPIDRMAAGRTIFFNLFFSKS